MSRSKLKRDYNTRLTRQMLILINVFDDDKKINRITNSFQIEKLEK